MLGSPSAFTSHSVESLPGRQFSAMIEFFGLSHIFKRLLMDVFSSYLTQSLGLISPQTRGRRSNISQGELVPHPILTWCYKSGWPSIAPTGVVWQGSKWPLVWFLSTKGVGVRQCPPWTVIPVSTKKGDSGRCVHSAHCHRSLLRWSQLGVGTFLPKIVLFMRIEIASKTATLCGAMLLSIP